MTLDLLLFKLDINSFIFWGFRISFIFIGIIYIVYVLLQLRQIGIMNSALKTRAATPIALVGIFHLIMVVSILIFLELLLFIQ